MNFPAPSRGASAVASARPSGLILLRLEKVTKFFGGVRAVHDFSLDVECGRIIGIIGPNGSGKTTLFNLISGLYPCQGSILFEGRPVENLPPHRIFLRGIARTFQNIRLFEEMMVIENLLVGMHTQMNHGVVSACLKTRSLMAEERRARDFAAELMRFFPELAGTDLEIAKNLSYANRRRVEILRALASRPKLLLLDEPAAGMNSSEAQKLLEDIRRVRDLGVTILMIEHNMSVMAKVADVVVAMDQGEKVAEGTFAEVSRNPRVLESYLGANHG